METLRKSEPLESAPPTCAPPAWSPSAFCQSRDDCADEGVCLGCCGESSANAAPAVNGASHNGAAAPPVSSGAPAHNDPPASVPVGFMPTEIQVKEASAKGNQVVALAAHFLRDFLNQPRRGVSTRTFDLAGGGMNLRSRLSTLKNTIGHDKFTESWESNRQTSEGLQGSHKIHFIKPEFRYMLEEMCAKQFRAWKWL